MTLDEARKRLHDITQRASLLSDVDLHDWFVKYAEECEASGISEESAATPEGRKFITDIMPRVLAGAQRSADAHAAKMSDLTGLRNAVWSLVNDFKDMQDNEIRTVVQQIRAEAEEGGVLDELKQSKEWQDLVALYKVRFAPVE